MKEIQPSNSLGREDIGDVTVLRVKVPMLRGDEVTDDLFQQTYSVVEDAGRSRIVLNCDSIEYLASVALAKLVTLMRKARTNGGRLALCKVNRTMEELLRVTHLSDILLVYQDEQEAVRSFG
jgi:anti-anti-sigma factor